MSAGDWAEQRAREIVLRMRGFGEFLDTPWDQIFGVLSRVEPNRQADLIATALREAKRAGVNDVVRLAEEKYGDFDHDGEYWRGYNAAVQDLAKIAAALSDPSRSTDAGGGGG